MDKLSRMSVIMVLVFLVATRLSYVHWDADQKLNILTWDAFGYYSYLPAVFIYQDVKKLDWVPGIHQRYGISDTLYQFSELPNGNKAGKYFVGIALLCLPFFLLGHLFAHLLGFAPDGFSDPYQFAVSLGAISYAVTGFWLLSKVLRKYFSAAMTAMTVITIALGTNFIQYAAVDSGMSHVYIFFLYALLVYLSDRWHTKPTRALSFGIGAVIGLGIICRPTEVVMILIPLLYAFAPAGKKITFLRSQYTHILLASVGLILFAMPQFVYWKLVTGNWIYDVGSKWVFLNPNWGVLIGWEKGWFIYTPITLLFVIGLFYMKQFPFRKSVLYFFLLNTWIILAWFDRRYGASYSARALVQSYAVLSLPLACFLTSRIVSKMKWLWYGLILLLISVNLFQTWQYNKTILHYDDMNYRYYRAIFLNPSPSPRQMSLLDTDEYLSTDNIRAHLIESDTTWVVNANNVDSVTLALLDISRVRQACNAGDCWLRIRAKVKSGWGAFNSHIGASLEYNGQVKSKSIRLENGISRQGEWNTVEFDFMISSEVTSGLIRFTLMTTGNQDINLREFGVAVVDTK